MGIIIPENEALLSFRWGLNGKPREMVSTIGITKEGDTTPPSWVTPLAALNEALKDGPFDAANYNGYYSYEGLRLQIQKASGAFTYQIDESVTGTAAEDPIVVNSSILIRKATAFGGRSNRGRMFFPPAFVGEGDVGRLGEIEPAKVIEIRAICTGILSALDDSGFTPVLFHSDGSPSTVITTLFVESTLATQRRRMRR